MPLHRLSSVLSVLSVLAIVALPSAAAAQSWRSQLDRQIAGSSLLATLASTGYEESHDVQYGTLRAGTDTSVTIRVSGGQPYAFVAFCDNDCGDVDLYLYDESGTVVDRDVADDDEPLVRVQPAEGATYRLRIAMPSCTTSICGWALVSRRDPPATPVGWRAEIERQLDGHQMVATTRQAGFSASGDGRFGLLAAADTRSETFSLVAGRSYRFIGFCDNDCSDLDLRLEDASGSETAKDIADDDYPVLNFTPKRSGTYTVRVSMASCSTGVCGWGVQAFSR